jgi:Family of unknown function (DUF6519)/Kelch motif/Concanavalin A-like lectin/glucanases superfamily
MKGNFSLLPRPAPRFSGVMLQQGRVLLDSDWNTQLAVLRQRIESEAADLVGVSGAPAHAAGFDITRNFALALNRHLEQPQQSLTVAASSSLSFTRPFTFELSLRVAGPGLVISLPGWFELRIIEDSGLRPQLQFLGSAPLVGPDALARERSVALAVVCDTHTGQLYVDGIPLQSGVPTQVPQGIDAQPVTIGGLSLPGEVALPCDLDEVRIWSAAQDARAIRARLFTRLTGSEADLACYLLFDPADIAGQRVRDQSGHRNDAVLSGGRPDVRLYGVWIGPGRYYIDGIQAANGATLSYGGQAGFPLPPVPSGAQGMCLFYLDVWEQLVTALQDPAIRETALGGPDTTAWTYTAWRVGALLGADAKDLDQQWRDLLEAQHRRGALAVRRVDPLASALGNNLYRVEIHDSGTAAIWPPRSEVAARQVKLAAGIILGPIDPRDPLLQPGGWVWACSGTAADSPHCLAQVTKILGGLQLVGLSADLATASELLLLPPGRVTTFKWSRMNGCIAFPIAGVVPRETEGGSPEIEVMLGSGGFNGFDLQSSDWVEIENDVLALTHRQGPLFQVTRCDQSRLSVVLSCPDASVRLPDLTAALHPMMRRWDVGLGSDGMPNMPAARPIEPGLWVVLENGVEVRFEAGDYVSGDYWTFTARDVGGGRIDWPGGADASHPPQGIRHGYARLARLSVDSIEQIAGATNWRIDDERVLFEPLTTKPKPLVPPVPSWQHVTAAPPGLADPMAALFDAPDLVVIDGGQRVLWRLSLDGHTWTQGPQLPRLHFGGAAAFLGHDLFVIGGHVPGASGVFGDVDILGPDGKWRVGPPLPVPVAWPAVAVLGDRLYVLGGQTADGRVSPTVQIMQFGQRWTAGPPLATARTGLVAACVGPRLYAIGGQAADGQALGVNEEYDPISNTWRSRAALPAGYAVRSAAGIATAAVVVGTDAGPQAMAYAPQRDLWSLLPTPPLGMNAAAAAADSDTVYAVTADAGGAVIALPASAAGSSR